MGRAVRPTAAADIQRLTDRQLDDYMAETQRRIGVMTNAALRNSYRKQLRIAERIKAERTS